MPKSISIIIIALLLLTTLVGCGDKQKDESSNHVKSVLNESITKTYEQLNSFFRYDGRYNFTAGIFCITLKELESYYPILVELTCLTETDGYAVLRMHDDSIGDYYLYLFCRISANDNTSWHNNWFFAGRAMKISNRLSVKDFDGIRIGSTIEDVAKVDPVTSVSLPEYDFNGTNPILSIDTFHYTEEDGILRITFKRKTVEDEFLVSGIDLDPTYEVDWYDGSDIESHGTVKQKIKPEHLPD